MSTTTIQDIYRRMAPTGAGSVSVITATDIAVRVRDEAVAAERERIIARLEQVDAVLMAPGIPLDAIVDVVRDEYPEEDR